MALVLEFLGGYTDLASLITRIFARGVMVVHGYPKVFSKKATDLTKTCIRKAIDQCDILIMTTGVFVGEKDFVARAFTDLFDDLSRR